MNCLHAIFITAFPEMLPGTLNFSLAGKALQKNIWSYEIVNLRNYGITKHKNIDDYQYGGGEGMVLRADVLGQAIDDILSKNTNCSILYPSPRGKVMNQYFVKNLAQEKRNIIFICGRFEGIDERILDEYAIEQFSLGDYIISGGELAAITLLDAVIRILPGVISNNISITNESFEDNYNIGYSLLEAPLYTRPRIWKNRSVPEILLSGDDKKIKEWKKEKSLTLTRYLRPDLIKK